MLNISFALSFHSIGRSTFPVHTYILTPLITFLVSQGSSSTKNELLDFFDMDPQSPTASALNQQRAKLSPDALEAVFRHFNHFASFYDQKRLRYRFLAADGSTFTFFSKPAFAPEEYHVSEGHSIKGFYSMHLNAFTTYRSTLIPMR